MFASAPELALPEVQGFDLEQGDPALLQRSMPNLPVAGGKSGPADLDLRRMQVCLRIRPSDPKSGVLTDPASDCIKASSRRRFLLGLPEQQASSWSRRP